MKTELRHFDNQVTMNVDVVVTREFRLRMFLGLWLIRLACRVMRCDVEVR